MPSDVVAESVAVGGTVSGIGDTLSVVSFGEVISLGDVLGLFCVVSSSTGGWDPGFVADGWRTSVVGVNVSVCGLPAVVLSEPFGDTVVIS